MEKQIILRLRDGGAGAVGGGVGGGGGGEGACESTRETPAPEHERRGLTALL